MSIITIDQKTSVGAGLHTFQLWELDTVSQDALPGERRWGIEKLWLESVWTIAATTGQAGATPGKRVVEFVDFFEVKVNGYQDLACHAGGRALIERATQIRGKLPTANPTDIPDTTTSEVRRTVLPFHFKDERLEDSLAPVPHAFALGRGGHVKINVLSAPVTGISLTSATHTLKAKLVPIRKGHIPVQVSFIEEVLGEGAAGTLRSPLPRPDAMIAMWLHLTGDRASTGDRAQFNEATELVALSVDAKKLIEQQSIESLAEQWNSQVPTDAALDESTSAPETLRLLYPTTGTVQLSKLAKTRGGGFLRFNQSSSDGGNAASGVSPRIMSDGYNGVAEGSKAEADYGHALGIAGRVAVRKRPMSKKGHVPAAVRHLIPGEFRRV